MERKTYLKIAALFLIVIYSVGRFGLASRQYSPQFVNTTWVSLVLTAVLTFSFHQYFTKRFILTSFAIFIAGFMVEWLGVETGKIFGEYNYGETLGFKIAGIPLLMGLNWLVLVYSVCHVINIFRLPKLLAIWSGALLLVLLDFFIEPFAVQFNLWNWKNTAVPSQNYLAWFIISFIMLWFMQQVQNKDTINNFAVFVYFLQLIFFASFLFY
jgi:putative membrane protein